MEFTLREYQIIKAVAYRCSTNKTQRTEIESFLCLWMVEHWPTVQRYRTEPGGENKLFSALRNTHYREVLNTKRTNHPELFITTPEKSARLRAKIGEDITKENYTSAVSYINRHKYRTALVDYFTGRDSLVKTAERNGIHQQALYRAKSNSMLIAKEKDPRRYM